MNVIPGTENVSVYFLLRDALTDLPYTTTGGETSFNLIYQRPGAVQVSANSAGAHSAATDAHVDTKIFHCGAGVWRADFPDLAFAAEANEVLVMLTHDTAAFVAAAKDISLEGDVAAILADTNELQTNQGNWLTATGFSTHSAADVKTAIEAAGSSIALILADTGELQTNQGNWVTATGFSTFNSASDTVARVTLVDTTTTNTDMRGTNSAALASVCTEARLAELDAANLPADVAALSQGGARNLTVEEHVEVVIE